MSSVVPDLADRLTDLVARHFEDPQAAAGFLEALRAEVPHRLRLENGRPDWPEFHRWVQSRPDEYGAAVLRVLRRDLPDDHEIFYLPELVPPGGAAQKAVQPPADVEAAGPAISQDVSAEDVAADAAATKDAPPVDVPPRTLRSVIGGDAGAPLAPHAAQALRAAVHALSDPDTVGADLLLAALLLRDSWGDGGSIATLQRTLLPDTDAEPALPVVSLGFDTADSHDDRPASLSDDAAAVLAAAAGIARSVAPAGVTVEIDTRHLAAASLAASPVAPPGGAKARLAAAGIDLDGARRALLDDVARSHGDENLDIWRDLLGRTEPPAEAGYRPDHVHRDAVDLLEIEQEVRAICGVIAARRVSPPLSLGLFGDWGTGKSFFMAKMQKYIDDMTALALERERQGDATPFCSRVVQIEFNAWHYADSNLWACLVTGIFDALHLEFSGGADSPAAAEMKLVDELRRARGIVEATERQAADAAAVVDQARQTLETAVEERRRAESTVRALLADVPDLLRGDEPTMEALRDAANRLGYPEAAQSYEVLEATALELRSTGTRLRAIGRMITDSPFSWRMLPLLIGLLLVPPVVGMVLLNGEWMDAFGVRIVEVATLIAGAGTWIGVQLRHAGGLAASVEDALRSSRERRDARIEQDTAGRRKALELAIEEEESARQRLAMARSEQQRIEAELREFMPGRQLQRLIEERAAAGDYTRHLGIVSLIRKDFERMSELLPRLAERDGEEERPPIQRIILYIDDLDRCRPQRVVEVLEAVHLLMAFPLFIVVVGVDPRWLRRCLETHHAHLLTGDAPKPRADGQPAARNTTPQDYLEKIFQIPFALRPIEETGYRNMVLDLLTPAPTAAPDRIVVRAAVDAATADGDDDYHETIEAADVSELNVAAATTSPDVAQQNIAPRDAGVMADDEEGAAGGDVAPPDSPALLHHFAAVDQLSFSDGEVEAMQTLAAFFRTPRAVKRFVNVYRLVRAGVRPHEMPAFEGTAARPGEYRAALVFLAAVTGFPNAAPRMLAGFHSWLHNDGALGAATPWDAFVASLQYDYALDDGSGDPRDGAAAEWMRLRRVLAATTGNDFITADAAVLTRWARRAARYSFSVHLHELV